MSADKPQLPVTFDLISYLQTVHKHSCLWREKKGRGLFSAWWLAKSAKQRRSLLLEVMGFLPKSVRDPVTVADPANVASK
mmetsp:Transcript_21478/g.54141  ORF Transcript_21478/g.54141 Transcript_21478/m.54141 type:complete len:80 (+) Transcript_21478:92-331(+)